MDIGALVNLCESFEEDGPCLHLILKLILDEGEIDDTKIHLVLTTDSTHQVPF
jgi:hypothetical protein